MNERFIVVIDAGTTRIRCYVFNSEGTPVVQRSAPWSYIELDAQLPYATELDMDRIWKSTARTVGECVADARVENGNIEAITVTSQRQGVVFLDKADQVLYAGTNTDLRAVFEGAAIDEAMGERVFGVTGRLPSFLFTAAKLRWFKLHLPEVYDKIDRIVTLADWLRWKLSGELANEATLAAEAGMLDIRQGRWCTQLFDELGVRSNAPVPVERAGGALGQIRPKVADSIGIPAGVPVFISPADTQCALLGLGVIRAGQIGIVAGWSIPLLMLTDIPVFDEARRIWTGRYVDDALWSLESTCGDAGNSYRWLADTMWAGQTRPFECMDAAVAKVPAGSEGVLAFLGPSRMDMSRIGMRTGGFIFPTPVAFSGIERKHLTRAALECIAFMVRANLEQLESVSGEAASKIALGGGMIATTAWVNMLPNVLGRSLEVAAFPNVTAVGAYVTAMAALDGAASPLQESGARATTRTFEPTSVNTAEYDQRYRRWTEMAQRLESAGM